MAELYLLAEFDAGAQAVLAGYGRALSAQGLTGRQTPGIPHHLTLGSFPMEREADLAERLARVCGQRRALSLCMGHIGLFGREVLFVAPNANEELLALRAALCGQPCRGAHPWAPHATVLIDQPEAILRALPALTEAFEPFTARVVSVSLYAFFPARLIRRCALAGGRGGA
ncbi:MAG: 2'-5' RNA ligase family protein [Christensenellales bacterium]